ncbi:hypothetical protein C1H46_029689 [Malus baccata]|uniref:Uncharacterized protein n=1 Tax=Malus baccata TaxID=106549 RepID=A0A540LE60_MALBA|nr:hypothetical protein C1H46_029689 [Malus baccata]
MVISENSIRNSAKPHKIYHSIVQLTHVLIEKDNGRQLMRLKHFVEFAEGIHKVCDFRKLMQLGVCRSGGCRMY